MAGAAVVNGVWNTLVSVNPGTDIGCGNEQYVEVYTAGTGRHFPFPTVTVGDGTPTGMNIADSATAAWHSWNTSIPTSEGNNYENYYFTTWLAKYYSWQVSSSNAAPSASVFASPSQGTLTTSFFASISASDPNGDSISYRIDWGDGASTFSSSGSHQYSSTGTKVITGTATDQWGASTSSTTTVRVCTAVVLGNCV